MLANHDIFKIVGFPAYLDDNISELLVHLLLRALKPLPQIIAHTSSRQERTTGLLGSLDLDQSADVLHGTSHQRCAQHAVGDSRGLLGAILGVEVQEGEVNVSLEMRAEPRGQVGVLY